MPFSQKTIDLIKKIASSPIIRVVITAGPGFGDQASSKQQLDHLLSVIKTITNQNYANTIEVIYDQNAKTQVETLFGISNIGSDSWLNDKIRLVSQSYFTTNSEQFSQTLLGLTGVYSPRKKYTYLDYKTDYFIALNPYLGERGQHYAIWTAENKLPVVGIAPNSTIHFPIPSFSEVRKFLTETTEGKRTVSAKPGIVPLMHAIEHQHIECFWIYGLNAEYFPHINVKYTVTHLLLSAKKALSSNKPIVMVLSNDLSSTEKNELYQLMQQLANKHSVSTTDTELFNIANESNFTSPVILQATSPNFAEKLKKLMPQQLAIIDLGSTPKPVFTVCAAKSWIVYEGANTETLGANAEAISRLIHCNPGAAPKKYVSLPTIYQLAGNVPTEMENTLLDIERYGCITEEKLTDKLTPQHRVAIDALTNFLTNANDETSSFRKHIDKLKTTYKESDRLIIILEHLAQVISQPRLTQSQYDNFINAIKAHDNITFNNLITAGLNPWLSTDKRHLSPVEFAVTKAFDEKNISYITTILSSLSIPTTNIHLRNIADFDEAKNILKLFDELQCYMKETDLSHVSHLDNSHFLLAAQLNMTAIFSKACAQNSSPIYRRTAAKIIALSKNTHLQQQYTDFIVENINEILMSIISSISLPELKLFLVKYGKLILAEKINVRHLLESSFANPSPEIALYLLENNLFNCRDNITIDMFWLAHIDNSVFEFLFDHYFNQPSISALQQSQYEYLLKSNKPKLWIKAFELGWLTAETTFNQGRYKNIPIFLHPNLPTDAFNYFIKGRVNNTDLIKATNNDYFDIWQKKNSIQARVITERINIQNSNISRFFKPTAAIMGMLAATPNHTDDEFTQFMRHDTHQSKLDLPDNITIFLSVIAATSVAMFAAWLWLRLTRQHTINRNSDKLHRGYKIV